MTLKGLRDPVGVALVGSELGDLMGVAEGATVGTRDGLGATGFGAFENAVSGGLIGLYLLIVGATVPSAKVRPDRCISGFSDGVCVESVLSLASGVLYGVMVAKTFGPTSEYVVSVSGGNDAVAELGIILFDSDEETDEVSEVFRVDASLGILVGCACGDISKVPFDTIILLSNEVGLKRSSSIKIDFAC